MAKKKDKLAGKVGRDRAHRDDVNVESPATPSEPPGKMKTKAYEREMVRLHAELVAMQEWVKASGAKICVVFEGRDTAGKGGTIKRIVERVSPRVFKIVALSAPTDRERSQMYVQRYLPHFPAGGEVVIFDRSWYNRAGVEPVMGASAARPRDPGPDPPRDQHRERPERRDRRPIRDPVPGDRRGRRGRGEPELAYQSGEEIALAIVVAIVVGGLGGRFTSEARRRGWASQASEIPRGRRAGDPRVCGRDRRRRERLRRCVRGRDRLPDGDRTFGAVRRVRGVDRTGCVILVPLLFGVALVGPVILAGFDTALVGYALLSLTIVRMVPVAIALVGAHLRPDTIALIGWFGPRGLASVVFLFVALDELGPAHPATDALVRAVVRR